MFGHPTNKYVSKSRIEVKPFKSIGNPATSLFELDSDIAFVMILSYFTAPDVIVNPCWKGCADAT